MIFCRFLYFANWSLKTGVYSSNLRIIFFSHFTKSNLKSILISSHIVPWSKSNDDERLDVENGILLSPNIDSLFDKHLISFEDDGSILISDKLDSLNRQSLSIDGNIKIPVSEGMKKYLKRHREEFNK